MRTSYEGKRGCGFRKPGALYLVSDGAGEPCSKLPFALEVCPTCGQGIKPSRGWTWIKPAEIMVPEWHDSDLHSSYCPLATGPDKAGLVWIGSKYYTPAEFRAEANSMGISRRINALPRGFEIGDWVFLAHREAEWTACVECGDGVPDPECPACSGSGRSPVAAIFYVFQPARIEYVVKGDETLEEIEALNKRGIEPVKVIPVTDQESLV